MSEAGDRGAGARTGVVRCGVAAVLFGSTVPLASRLVDDTGAPMLAGLLYVGAALAVVPFVGSPTLAVRALRRGGRWLGVAVVAGGLLGPLLLMAGLSRTPAATASLLLNLEVVATATIAALAFGEHLGTRVRLGVAFVVVAGVALGWSNAPELRVGALLIVGACVCWGLDNSITAGLDRLAPEHITLAKGAVAGTTNIAIAFATGAAMPNSAVVGAALVLGAVGYGASITLWISGARRIGAARGQLVFSAAPFVGVLVAWTALGDDVTTTQVAALCAALVGVTLVVGSGHEHAHEHARLDHVHLHDHDVHHRHEHSDDDAAPSHSHRHVHEPFVHVHPHVPDLHHRHPHPADE